jgi:hypothetical protein
MVNQYLQRTLQREATRIDAMTEQYWRIRGYNDSSDLIFDRMIPYGSISSTQLTELLKCLAAKARLSYDEIIGAYVKRRTRLANDLLDVQQSHSPLEPDYYSWALARRNMGRRRNISFCLEPAHISTLRKLTKKETA